MTTRFSSHPAIPISWYFDEQIYAIEQRELFGSSANFVGHELLVPEPGDYHVLDGGRHVLVRDQDGTIARLSNVCRHRQAAILSGRGRIKCLQCPIHTWTYSLDGQLKAASGFSQRPDGFDLERIELERYRGLLFAGPRRAADDLAGWESARYFDFQNYRLDRILVDEYEGNWKTFIEVYIELYHVAASHPGLSHFAECGRNRWEFGEQFNSVAVEFGSLDRPGSSVYARWHERVRASGKQHDDSPLAAIWLAYYPGLMLEYYPWSLIVSRVVPGSSDRFTITTEFYYPGELLDSDREFAAAQQAAYIETAQEDRENIARITEGRRALYQAGRDEWGPFHSELEAGLPHFHNYLRNRVVQQLSD